MSVKITHAIKTPDAAGDITNTPAGNIAATTVQAAINELDSEKQPLDADLTAIAALSNADNNFIVGNGSAWVAESGSTARTSLGLGTAAVKNTGTSGDAVPLLDQNALFSGAFRLDGAFGVGRDGSAPGGIYFNRDPDNPFFVFSYGSAASPTNIGQLRASGASGIMGFTEATGATYGFSYNPTTRVVTVAGSFTRGAPVTKTGDFTVAATENWLIINKGSSCTVTLPAASSFPGRELYFTNIGGSFTTISASSNVVPRAGGSAGTAILPGTDGAWATLVSDGTNWIIMQSS